MLAVGDIGPVPRAIQNWDQRFESAFLQRGVRNLSLRASSAKHLFAAAQEGRVFVKMDCAACHRVADLDVHIIMDNVSSHKTQAIRNWFAKRPRWHVHYTPTSASWINQVERFFANLTEKQLRRGVHRSTAELEAAIKHYINITNAEAKPFVWTKSADAILATVKRFCLATLKTAQTQAESRH